MKQQFAMLAMWGLSACEAPTPNPMGIDGNVLTALAYCLDE